MTQYFLKKLHLKNFRNIDDQILSFSPKINCIFGNNGNGKTNLLEAIYYLSYKKSFRKKVSFPHLINVECEKPEILLSSLFISDEDEQLTYSGKILPDSNEWYLNNKPSKKKIDVKSVFINPFDSFLFHSTSSFRRAWFDQHLSILSTEYKKANNDLTASLRFRNSLLKKKPAQFKEQIRANDPRLAELSFQITNLRIQMIKELNAHLSETFKLIFHEEHQLELEYSGKFLNTSVQKIHDFYQENLEKDAIVGHTTSGVHRDDYLFNFDGFNSYDYCSLGQQKMSFLSLLFAYIELFRYKFKTYPIVLIDDVSGELDHRRWQNLISFLKEKNFQVMITTANENFKKELEKIDEAQKIFIEDGLVKI